MKHNFGSVSLTKKRKRKRKWVIINILKEKMQIHHILQWFLVFDNRKHRQPQQQRLETRYGGGSLLYHHLGGWGRTSRVPRWFGYITEPMFQKKKENKEKRERNRRTQMWEHNSPISVQYKNKRNCWGRYREFRTLVHYEWEVKMGQSLYRTAQCFTKILNTGA